MSAQPSDVVAACWNRIGVRGDQSCEELPRHIHCRNCPVYSAGARALLDTPAPAGYSRQWAEHYAQAPTRVELEARSAMVFRVGTEWFALRTQVCVEVASMRPIHSLPHRRNGAVLGVASVRGELVVCISLAAIMGLERHAPAVGPQRLLEIGWEEGAVALPVDEVNGVHRFRTEDFRPTPATVSQAQARFTQALIISADRTIGFLDDERLRDAINRSLA